MSPVGGGIIAAKRMIYFDAFLDSLKTQSKQVTFVPPPRLKIRHSASSQSLELRSGAQILSPKARKLLKFVQTLEEGIVANLEEIRQACAKTDFLKSGDHPLSLRHSISLFPGKIELDLFLDLCTSHLASLGFSVHGMEKALLSLLNEVMFRTGSKVFARKDCCSANPAFSSW